MTTASELDLDRPVVLHALTFLNEGEELLLVHEWFHVLAGRQTDLYRVVVTVLGCVDLQSTARGILSNRCNTVLGRRDKLIDESPWHPRDRAVGRWYSWLLLIGCAASLGTLAIIGLPLTLAFLLIGLAQCVVTGVVLIRERRRRRTAAPRAHLID